MPPPMIVVVPFVPLVFAVMVSVSPSGSVSFVSGDSVVVMSSTTGLVGSLTAFGASLSSVTSMVMVFAVGSRLTPPFVVPPLSRTWNVKDA